MILRWDLDDPEQVAPLVDMLKQLIGFYTKPEYRYLNDELFERVKSLSGKEQAVVLRDELANSVLSFHVVKAAELAKEMERQRAEISQG